MVEIQRTMLKIVLFRRGRSPRLEQGKKVKDILPTDDYLTRPIQGFGPVGGLMPAVGPDLASGLSVVRLKHAKTL